jgi:hypothetical protein
VGVASAVAKRAKRGNSALIVLGRGWCAADRVMRRSFCEALSRSGVRGLTGVRLSVTPARQLLSATAGS